MQRPSGRNPNQLRDVRITRRYTKHAEGSVLVEFGDTKVEDFDDGRSICTLSVENVCRLKVTMNYASIVGGGDGRCGLEH